MRSALHGVIACALVAGACAKAPDAKVSADAKPEVEAGVEANGEAGAVTNADAGHVAVPGLPMPQQFPHVVWDAAAADASGRGAVR